MVNRRDFFISGVAAAAFPLVIGRASARSSVESMPGLGATAIYKVVYDERFPASVAYGHAAMRRGLAVQAIRGDITDFWYYDLYPQWRKEPVAIAGLTAHGPIFCLERLSWDFGMRVSLREKRPDELITWMIAPRQRA
ncbi:MAG: hypothetical protein ACRET4_08695 [Steroidobacteraceae bacterium]